MGKCFHTICATLSHRSNIPQTEQPAGRRASCLLSYRIGQRFTKRIRWSVPDSEFPTNDTMTITETRFNKLVERVHEIAERVAKVEAVNAHNDRHRQRPSNLKEWLPVGAPIVALIAVTITIGIHLDNKIGAGAGPPLRLETSGEKRSGCPVLLAFFARGRGF
jgi:hypothetical protein